MSTHLLPGHVPEEPPDLSEIPGHPGYLISRQGQVWHRNRQLQSCGTRYKMVSLKLSSGKFQNFNVGRLVLLTFTGPCPPGQEVLHGPAGRHNDALSNLRWGTRKENMADKKRDGTWQAGERHGMSKLTRQAVQEIRELGSSIPKSELALQYGVGRRQISNILRGKNWV